MLQKIEIIQKERASAILQMASFEDCGQLGAEHSAVQRNKVWCQAVCVKSNFRNN